MPSFMNTKEDKNTKRYYIKNREKTNLEFVVCRSNWEKQFAQWCDLNDNILKWSSEPIAIPYYDPVKQKERRYFPDVLMKCKTKSGDVKVYLVEIKPYKDTQPSKKSKGKSKKTILHEQTTHLTNMAKFKSAMQYCKKRGWIFKIITEKELFNK